MKPLIIDVDRWHVIHNGEPVQLAPKEFRILLLLAEANGKVVDRETITRSVWESEKAENIDSRTIDQHVARFRRKVGLGYIMTVATAGYKAQNVVLTRAKAIKGKIQNITRTFGSRPGSLVSMWVEDVLPHVKKGDKFTVA